MSGVLLVCAAATSSLAQTPGWSRGQQLLPITYDQCVSRASQALQAEGFRIDHAAGDFAVGIKEVHTAVIMCNPGPEGKMWANIVVASNGEGGGSLRERLQAQMEKPGTVSAGGGDPVLGGWVWAFAPPGQPLVDHGAVTFNPDGTIKWSGGSQGSWRKSGNTYTLKWADKEAEDIVNMSDDGKSLTGTNNAGWSIRGTRQQ